MRDNTVQSVREDKGIIDWIDNSNTHTKQTVSERFAWRTTVREGQDSVEQEQETADKLRGNIACE